MVKIISRFGLLIFISGLSIFSQEARSQPADNAASANQSPDVYPGASLDMGGSSLGLCADISLLVRANHVFMHASCLVATTEQLFRIFMDRDYIHFTSFQICVGRCIIPGHGGTLMLVAGGLSINSFTYYTVIQQNNWFGAEFNSRNVHTIGIPLEVTLDLPPKSGLGFELSLKSDINREKIFLGITVGVRFGRLDKKSGM